MSGDSENVRWDYGPVVYIGLDVQGSNDNYPYPETDGESGALVTRSAAEIQRQRNEETARKAADLHWLSESYAYAKRIGAKGILIDWQADPNFALARLARERQCPLAEALAGRVEQMALEVQPLDRVVIWGLRRAVAPPAVGPVVVPGDPDHRPLELVEVRQRGRVQAVVARPVASGLQVAVEDRKRDVALVDVREQVRVLRAAECAIRHVTEQADCVILGTFVVPVESAIASVSAAAVGARCVGA